EEPEVEHRAVSVRELPHDVVHRHAAVRTRQFGVSRSDRRGLWRSLVIVGVVARRREQRGRSVGRTGLESFENLVVSALHLVGDLLDRGWSPEVVTEERDGRAELEMPLLNP